MADDWCPFLCRVKGKADVEFYYQSYDRLFLYQKVLNFIPPPLNLPWALLAFPLLPSPSHSPPLPFPTLKGAQLHTAAAQPPLGPPRLPSPSLAFPFPTPSFSHPQRCSTSYRRRSTSPGPSSLSSVGSSAAAVGVSAAPCPLPYQRGPCQRALLLQLAARSLLKPAGRGWGRRVAVSGRTTLLWYSGSR